MKLLEKDPARRPKSGREVAEALKVLQPEGTVVVVAPAQPIQEANPWADLDAGSTDLVSAPIPAKPATAKKETRPKPGPANSRKLPAAPSRPPTVAKRAKKGMLIGGGVSGLILVIGLLIWAMGGKGGNKEGDKVSDAKAADPKSKSEERKPKIEPVKKKDSPAPPGPPPNALLLSGAQAQLPIENLPFELAGPFTMEGVFTPIAKRTKPIYSYFRGGGGPILLGHVPDSDSTPRLFSIFDFPDNRVLFNTGIAIDSMDGKTTHVAFTWSGTVSRIFLNGKKLDELSTQFQFKTPDRNLWIGDGFEGTIREIRISNVVRYQEDFMPATRHTSDANTLALYHCDEDQGETLLDSSPNKRHGKISGGKWVRADISMP